MATVHGKRLLLSPVLCAVLSAFLWPRIAISALPPASSGTQEQSAAGAKNAGAPSVPATPTESADVSAATGWYFPPIHLGGSISYDIRSSSGQGFKMMQRGVIGTLRAATETYIWEPWFARLGGTLNLSSSVSGSSGGQGQNGVATGFQSTSVSGSAYLRVLQQSRFPFQGHWSRSDNRLSSELLSTGNFVSERFGFEQRYVRVLGDASLAWERSTQQSDEGGKTRQDTLHLRASHNLELQRINGNASLARNKHATTGERTAQDSITIQHSYTPIPSTSVETMLNASQFDYRLAESDSDTRLAQASTMLFWRPEQYPLNVTAGWRMLGMAVADRRGADLAPAGNRIRNANLNLGLSYELSPQTRISASANANFTESNGRSAVTSNESVSVAYQPERKKLGNFDYSWSTGATASHFAGADTGSSQLALQISHRLGRSYALEEGASLHAEVSQSISATAISSSGATGAGGSTRQLSHGAALSWNKRTEGANSMVRLSVNDSRALDGKKEYFQMINLQASSDLPTSLHSSWNGSLTVQATRQGGTDLPGAGSGGGFDRDRIGGFVTTSTGTLSYQNQRLFRVRGLRYRSDLRLSSEALLPLLGGPQDQELTAWENRFDYSIGRLQLRVSALISHSRSPVRPVSGAAGAEPTRQGKTNRSIMFSVRRSFGDL